jgi:outer membrane lipoprotein
MKTSLLTFRRSFWRSTLIVIALGQAALLLNACTPVISPQLMDQVDQSLTYNSLAAHPDEYQGKIALLGGTIVQTVPKPGETEVEVVQKDLLFNGEPRLTDKSEGRFLVVVDRFLDPAIYRPERGLTVAGKVQASVVRRIGEIDYRYPVIAALEMHLWNDPLPYPYPYYYPYAYPYYYPWWGWRYPGYPY